MIGIGIILALTVAVIVGVFWQEIVEWIKKAVNKIKQVLGIEPEGVKTFVNKTVDGFKNKSKYYVHQKVTKEWQEVVYTKQVSESDIPADILAKVRTASIDEDISTTEELKLAINA